MKDLQIAHCMVMMMMMMMVMMKTTTMQLTTQVQVQVFIDTLAAQRPNNLIKREKV